MPEKVKLFMWSAYRDTLPAKVNRIRRRVPVDSYCPVCAQDGETIIHALKNCQFVRAVWIGCSLNLRASEVQVDGFADFFDMVTEQLNDEQLVQFCMVCWALWTNRNEVLWNNVRRQPTQVIELARRCAMECKVVMGKPAQGSSIGMPVLRNIKWQPPDFSWYKLNVDGALFVQNKSYGIGAVIRNHNGEVMAAMIGEGEGLLLAKNVEAYSLRRGLQWAFDMGVRRLQVECDCASVVARVLASKQAINFELAAVLLDCKSLVGQFDECRLQHVRREGNIVAHELAQRAALVEADKCWIRDVPEYLVPWINNDMRNL